MQILQTSAYSAVLILLLAISSSLNAAKIIEDPRFYQCLPEEEKLFEIIWNQKQGRGQLIVEDKLCHRDCQPRTFTLEKTTYITYKKITRQFGDKQPALPVKAEGLVCTLDGALVGIYIHKAIGAQ